MHYLDYSPAACDMYVTVMVCEEPVIANGKVLNNTVELIADRDVTVDVTCNDGYQLPESGNETVNATCTVQGNRALWTKGNKEIKECIPSEYTYGKDHRSDFW